MALAGWQVVILNAPVAGYDLTLPPRQGITVRSIAVRPSHAMRPFQYLQYTLAAARLALTFRPHVVYASDPLGAGPGLVASRLANSELVYHEHDTPNPGALRSRVQQLRRAAALKARFVVLPNAERARIAQTELGFRDEQLRIVWNLPCRTELPHLAASSDARTILYYHGSITPERVPESVVDAIAQSRHRICLRIMGYEAPGAPGYVARLVELGKCSGEALVEYLGQTPTREGLFAEAARAGIGLALMPRDTNDLNLRFMMGASNKAFDYMGAGLALLVSNLPEWVDALVKPGYGRFCDPADSSSIRAQLDWFAENRSECRNMGARGRAKIENDWNYEKAFAPLLESLAC